MVSDRQAGSVEASLRRLNIPMNNVVFMHRMQCGKKRSEVMSHIRNHKGSILDPKVGMRKEGQDRYDLILVSESSDKWAH